MSWRLPHQPSNFLAASQIFRFPTDENSWIHTPLFPSQTIKNLRQTNGTHIRLSVLNDSKICEDPKVNCCSASAKMKNSISTVCLSLGILFTSILCSSNAEFDGNKQLVLRNPALRSILLEKGIFLVLYINDDPKDKESC